MNIPIVLQYTVIQNFETLFIYLFCNFAKFVKIRELWNAENGLFHRNDATPLTEFILQLVQLYANIFFSPGKFLRPLPIWSKPSQIKLPLQNLSITDLRHEPLTVFHDSLLRQRKRNPSLEVLSRQAMQRMVG